MIASLTYETYAKNVITIEHAMTVHDATAILKENEISFLIIIQEGKPVVVTQTNSAEFLRNKLLINGMLENLDSEKD